MRKTYMLVLVLGFLAFNSIYSQYTESINTYRPGTSQGAFSVGKNVVQGEAGIGISRESHSIFENKTSGFEFQYMFRAGLVLPQLEFNLQGSFLNQNIREDVGNSSGPFTRSGFTKNTLGAKYLIYDPYKYGLVNKIDIRSWKANKKFSFKKLIPAVSAYVGANFVSTKSDFAHHNNSDNRPTKIQSSLSPKIIISAQNNWTEDLVFVSNFVFDDITTEFFDFRFILTSTYNFKGRWAILGEYELANSQIYKDHIFRAGGTYLINNDLQLDASVSSNVKDTPYKFAANVGISYRLDFHKPEDDVRIKTGELKEIEADIDQIKKDIDDGLLPPSVMKGKYKGVDLESYVEQEETQEEFDSVLNEIVPKKKKWWQKIGSKIGRKRRLRKKAIADTSSTSVSTTKVLGTGGRMSDFADDEFLQSKRESITPKERTPEEQAELEAKIAARQKKKGKKNQGPLIDPLTNEPFTEDELDSMSKREIKRLRKEQAELESLDDELDSLMNETQSELSVREQERARKKKEKEAKKKAKADKKAGIISDDIDDDFSIPSSIEDIDKELEKLKSESDKESGDKNEDDFTIPSSIEDIDKELEKLKAESEKESKADEKQRLKEEKRKAKEAKKKAKEDSKLEDDNPDKW